MDSSLLFSFEIYKVSLHSLVFPQFSCLSLPDAGITNMCRHTCLIKWTSVELYQSILCPVNILEWPRLKTVAQGVVYVLSSRVAPNEISTLWDPFTQWDFVFHLFF